MGGRVVEKKEGSKRKGRTNDRSRDGRLLDRDRRTTDVSRFRELATESVGGRIREFVSETRSLVERNGRTVVGFVFVGRESGGC